MSERDVPSRNRIWFLVPLFFLVLLACTCVGSGATPTAAPREDTPEPDEPASGRVSRTEGENEFKLWQETVHKGPAGGQTLPIFSQAGWFSLDDGDAITTDSDGEAELNLDACWDGRLYLFQDSSHQFRVATCGQTEYDSAALSCVPNGTWYAGECAGSYEIATGSAIITVGGTSFSVTYLPDRDQTTLIVALNDDVEVTPVTDSAAQPAELGSALPLDQGSFMFTMPDPPQEIAGFEPRVAHPLPDLPPVATELDIVEWLQGVAEKAEEDDVLPPDWPDFEPDDEPTEEPTEEPTDEPPTVPTGPGGSVQQGVISLGETVGRQSIEEEGDAWTFRDGPALVDIVLEGEDVNLLDLTLYDPEDVLLEIPVEVVDDQQKRMRVTIPDGQSYSIVVRKDPLASDSYALSVLPVEEPPPTAFEGLIVTTDGCEHGSRMREIAALDELTVQFSLCGPDAAFPAKIASPSLGIQPREWYESIGRSGPLGVPPVGTGPYVMGQWNAGESIVFRRFNDYWNESAFADTLVFRWNVESGDRDQMLRSGEVDGIDRPWPGNYPELDEDPNTSLFIRPELDISYIGMNNNVAPFDSLLVRRALATGIDRRLLVDNFFASGSVVADFFTPCPVPNGCVGESWYDFDPDFARELLAEAGFPDGFQTEIYYRIVSRDYLPDPDGLAKFLGGQLKENLNIDAELIQMESSEFIPAVLEGEIPGLFLLGWAGDYPDVTAFLDPHFGFESIISFGETYAEIAGALAAGASTAGPDNRRPHYEEANNLIREFVPMVPIAHSSSATAYGSYVSGAQASPMHAEIMAQMDPFGRDAFVWLQESEPQSLYCADESDKDTLRACAQVTESLLAYTRDGAAVRPWLATGCLPDRTLTVWTCRLREGVRFHDGSELDANDVVNSYGVQWDRSSPWFNGNQGTFFYFDIFWGTLDEGITWLPSS